jgi:hypothetical protein
VANLIIPVARREPIKPVIEPRFDVQEMIYFVLYRSLLFWLINGMYLITLSQFVYAWDVRGEFGIIIGSLDDNFNLASHFSYKINMLRMCQAQTQ